MTEAPQVVANTQFLNATFKIESNGDFKTILYFTPPLPRFYKKKDKWNELKCEMFFLIHKPWCR